MKKVYLALGLGLLWAGAVGCDTTAMSGLSPTLDKMLDASRGISSSDIAMDQTQLRQQLGDGTGVNCPLGRGTPAGVGQAGSGSGDRLRLRDGSCRL